MSSTKSPLLPFLELSQGEPDHRRVFTLRSDEVQSQLTGRHFTVDRLIGPDWVNVVATTADHRLVLVRQWRFGSRSFTWELPAGLVERGEDPLAAGLRELREETGYAPADPSQARVIGVVRPNPAFMSNVCTTVLAPGCTLVGAQELDPSEEIEVSTVPQDELPAKVASGELSTALGIVGLYWWERAQR
ncbi:MAG: NUDIX hydrolase [Deltaproteobacteria bacterium]|nr:NUDIX hydrolase [Deltaproteobacteria bacterium]